jgi:hypothetical protein
MGILAAAGCVLSPLLPPYQPVPYPADTERNSEKK